MKRVDLLITESREETENKDFSDSSGISDERFLRWANDAQERIYGLIQNEYPEVYIREAVIASTAQVETYPIPVDAYLGVRIEKVEYSSNGDDRHYYPLKAGRMFERFTGNASLPSFYFRRFKDILLQPTPAQAGKIRFTYQFIVPRVDKRRGKVLSATLTGSSITSLSLDPMANLDGQPISDFGYMTVVSKDGIVLMQNIPVASIDPTTGLVTLDGAFSFQVGETLPVGAYVCAGPFSTTHSQMPDVCERYLLQTMNIRAQKKDSNSDSQNTGIDLSALEAEILQSFAEADADTKYIPILDGQFLMAEEY